MREITKQSGSSLVEFAVVLPVVLLLAMGVLQTALAFHAKSNLNYALHEAARAGSADHAKIDAMMRAFERALVPYYGGGRTTAELATKLLDVRADLAKDAARIEILSPTSRSFDDFFSPIAAARLGVSERVIPNAGIIDLDCPRDRRSCPADPHTNSSGQTLQDANLLALRVTYGIPRQKQVPLAGRLYTVALRMLGIGRDDPFVRQLVEAGRIPLVARTTLRMLSEPIEFGPVVYSGGADHGVRSPPPVARLPGCPFWNPVCLDRNSSPNPDHQGGSGDCMPGDPSCDPDCGTRLCCVPKPLNTPPKEGSYATKN
jgi:TadE-like protein